MISEIFRVALHFLMFGLSFYCLSSLDFSKLILPVENRTFKAQMLLMLLSLALGYLAAQFILAIVIQL